MIWTGCIRSTQRKTDPMTTLSTANLVLKRGFCDEKAAINVLCHGTTCICSCNTIINM